MLKFSQKMIDITEEAISTKLMPKDNDKLPAISYRDYEDAESGWNIIKKAEKNCYIQFASNAAGMSSYGFYKANNGEIYIIEAWVNEITRVFIPSKDWDCLQHLINDKDHFVNKGS